MELREEECQALRALDQAFPEVRQGMDEELASTHRALEDKRQARAADLRNTNQTLNDAYVQSAIVVAELEQLRKECDELRDEHQATEWEREVAVQEHDEAIQ